MQKNQRIERFDAFVENTIEEYVSKEDFNAIATPLKSEQQIKDELRLNLRKELNYSNLSKELIHGVDLIHDHLLNWNDRHQAEKVRQELSHAFRRLKDLYQEYSQKNLTDSDQDLSNRIDPNASLWTGLYGISDETLSFIYDMVLTSFNKNEVQDAKSLLQILITFAPIIPSYWNALGFCFQTEGNLEKALDHYLIAENINQDYLDAHFYLARCYMAMNNKFLAREQVEKLEKLIATSSELRDQWEGQVEQLANEILN